MHSIGLRCLLFCCCCQDNGKERDQDEDWGEDTSEDAVKARMTDLSNGAAILTLNDDLDKTPKERLDLFYKFVAASKKAGGVPSIARDLVKIKAEAERLDVMEKAPGILAELIYSKNLLKEIKDYRPVMLHVSQWVVVFDAAYVCCQVDV